MSTNRLPAICASEESVRTWIGLDLICLRKILRYNDERPLGLTYHEDTEVEFLCHMGQLREELVQFLLTFCQLSSSTVVNTEAVHYAIDDEEAVFVASE